MEPEPSGKTGTRSFSETKTTRYSPEQNSTESSANTTDPTRKVRYGDWAEVGQMKGGLIFIVTHRDFSLLRKGFFSN